MEPRTVSTYESISIAWSPVAGRPNRICNVQYRVQGESNWRKSYPLWFDHRDWEYRGSLVELQAGTIYEIQLQLDDSEVVQTKTAKTWTEDVKIKDTVWVSSRNTPLVIRRGGNEEEGYVVYMPKPGEPALIEVQKLHAECVKIKRPYVIVRGLTLRGSSEHGIRINPKQHHIIIEQCEISDFGSVDANHPPFGRMFDSGIYTDGDGFTPYHIVIQDNRIHHPSYGANYPGQAGARSQGSRGPQAITLMRGGGVYVIRHNAIYSDSAHYFKDAMGEWRNFTYEGFPYRESDIHHNYISHCWDDAIEAEGGNQNVRIWANYTTRCAHHISTANINLGPIYIWRNISGITESSPGVYGSSWGRFLDPSQPDPSEEKPRGIAFLFHNTLTHPTIHGKAAGASPPELNPQVRDENNLFDSIPVNQREHGRILPGFNDGYIGKAPDIGAMEDGGELIIYGPRKK